MIVTAVEALDGARRDGEYRCRRARRQRSRSTGTLATAGLLLESETAAPAAGAAPDSVTTPCAPEPPATLSGLADERSARVGAGGGAPAGVTVSVPRVRAAVVASR